MFLAMQFIYINTTLRCRMLKKERGLYNQKLQNHPVSLNFC